MTKHPIDKIFKEKLKDFEKMPRATVWDKLDAQLDQKAPVSWWKRKVVWWSTGISATFLTVGLMLWQPQLTPLPAQTAAKMLHLQMKLEGMPVADYYGQKQATQRVLKTEKEVFTNQVSTNTSNETTSALQLSTNRRPVSVYQQKDVKKDPAEERITVSVNGNPGSIHGMVNKTVGKKTNARQVRKVLSEFDTLSGVQELVLLMNRDELKSHLPQPKAQPKIRVILKLSENMAGDREQDESEKGFKKIWKTIKGLSTDDTTKKKTKRKRSKLFDFLGDRDD